MRKLPNCPKCNSKYTYEDVNTIVCSECAHEWVLDMQAETYEIIKDSNGNVLYDGDSIIVTKDLKVKGSSSSKHSSRTAHGLSLGAGLLTRKNGRSLRIGGKVTAQL